MIYGDDLDLSRFCFGRDRQCLFVTLTSAGYLDYTLNLIESARRQGFSESLVVFVVDIDGYNALLARTAGTGVAVVYYPNRYKLTGLQVFRQGRWHHMSFCKIEILHSLLSRGHDVLYSDGDIVFLRDPRDFLQDRVGKADVLIQDDGASLETGASPDRTELCMGFLYLKSNAKTLEAFSPHHWRPLKMLASLWRTAMPRRQIRITDQRHFNRSVKHKLAVEVLPRALFPNGYYFTNSGVLDPDCYLIHFNYLVGDEKRQRMIDEGYYYLAT